MSDNNREGVRRNCTDEPEGLSIHTRKITDSCRDKDCIEDLRVYLTTSSQALLDGAAGAKVRCADLLYAYIDVEPVTFDRNRYCVDVTFYYRILADATVDSCRPAALTGLAVFSKRAVLCGEDSRARTYTSESGADRCDAVTLFSRNDPTAVVETLDPMVLSSKVKDVCECPCQESATLQIPASIRQMFDEELVLSGDRRRLFVTLGQFSIIRLERDAQLVVHVLDYALPTKECCDGTGCAEDPCDMFSRIPFPEEQFSPRNCDNRDSCNYTTIQ